MQAAGSRSGIFRREGRPGTEQPIHSFIYSLNKQPFSKLPGAEQVLLRPDAASHVPGAAMSLSGSCLHASFLLLATSGSLFVPGDWRLCLQDSAKISSPLGRTLPYPLLLAHGWGSRNVCFDFICPLQFPASSSGLCKLLIFRDCQASLCLRSLGGCF